MTWQHTARIGLVAVALGVAVAIVVLTRRESPPPKMPELATLDPNASLEGGPGRFVRSEEGRARVEIVYKASRRYDDGRMRFEFAEITGLDENKSTLRADVLETTGVAATGDRPNQFDLSGHVVLQTDDGLVVETERAHYDDGRGQVTMPGEMTFRRGRMSGRGVGAVYRPDARQRDASARGDGAGRARR